MKTLLPLGESSTLSLVTPAKAGNSAIFWSVLMGNMQSLENDVMYDATKTNPIIFGLAVVDFRGTSMKHEEAKAQKGQPSLNYLNVELIETYRGHKMPI